MSNPLTTYNPFTVYNYTGEQSLTGYSLPISLFTVILSSDIGTPVNQFKTNNVLWEFGDGNIKEGLSATHYYEFPGVYNITCYLYNSAGEVYKNT